LLGNRRLCRSRLRVSGLLLPLGGLVRSCDLAEYVANEGNCGVSKNMESRRALDTLRFLR
jgi:hypothetical protein